jgi:hypothetical protein
MSVPLSVCLDDATRTELETEARGQGLSLETYLLILAEAEARRLRRERIRVQSRAVVAYLDTSAEAREFYADWSRTSPVD